MAGLTMDVETMNALCIAHLQAQGFIVTRAEGFRGMITPGQVAKEAGLSPSGLWRRLHHVDCPAFEREEGNGGRILRLRPTPALMAWLTQPKQQGGKLTPAHLQDPA